MSEDKSTPAACALLPQHQQILRERAIPVEFAVAHGLVSVDLGERAALEKRNNLPRRWKHLPMHPVTGIGIPYQTCLDGVERFRVRSDVTSYVKRGEPGTSEADEIVEVPRYICQANTTVAPYIHDEVLKVASDVTVPIFVPEAPLKALCLTAHGFLAIGLGGVVAGCHDKGELDALGEIVAHPELQRILCNGRRVYIAFDAGLGGDDAPGNPLVAMGAARVWKALSGLGADVWLVRVPYFHPQASHPEKGQLWNPTDQGPDDFIARNGADAFRALVDAAVPADPQRRLEVAIEANPTDQAAAVGRIVRELFVQACLDAADGPTLSGVAGVTKGIIGKQDLQKIATEFRERIRTNLRKGEPDWVSKLACSASGTARSTRENVELALRHDPGLAGMLAWDEFGQTLIFQKRPPWSEKYAASKGVTAGTPWSDEDDIRLGSYLAERYDITDVQPSKLRAAVVVTAKETIVHPVRDYLTGLTWDGTPRLESWLSDYLGVGVSSYASLVGRWWLISGVARIMDPGCQVDHALVLEGSQGAAKTSALRALGGDWFSDADLGDLKSKEAALALQGVWVEELSEGAIYSRASAKDVKAFTTKKFDDVVPKYSNLRTRLPRQVIFAVTINEHSDSLVDSTGNRRFWPVACGVINVEALKLARDQLWAEAVVLYKAGTKWWPSTDAERALCAVEQEARQAHDPWEERVAEGLRSMETITIAGVLSILGLSRDKQGRHESLRAAACLRVLGWVEGPRTKAARPWVRGPKAEPYSAPAEPATAEEMKRAGEQASHLTLIQGGLEQDVDLGDELDLIV
jgi:predicted P-loop ATPase